MLISEDQVSKPAETKDVEFDVSGLSVLVAIPNYSGYIPIDLARSLLYVEAKLAKLGVGFGLQYERGNALMETTRNNLIYSFIGRPDYNRIFFIDDDIVFDPDDFIRILAFSSVYPVVSATYTVRNDNPYKVFLNMDEDKHPEFNEHGLLKVNALGMGFTCLTREVVENAWNSCTEYYNDEGVTKSRLFKMHVNEDGNFVGEDISFFKYLKSLGYQPLVDLDVILSHVGTKFYTAHPRFILEQVGLIKKEQ
jgi:hypothetical protein